MKPDDEIRKMNRDHGFRIYKVRPSNKRVLFEIAFIMFAFISIISIIKSVVSRIH